MVQKFSTREAISFGWDVTKNNLGFFILLLILVIAIFIVLGSISKLTLTKGNIFFLLIFYLIGIVVETIIAMGLVKISLKFYDNEKAKISDLFSSYPLFFKYLIGDILYRLIIIGGLILLIVPGIIWAIQFQFFGYLIIDKGLGPIEALKKSSKITKGAKWDLFLLGILLVLINILGVLALLVGLSATIPTTMIANAFVYRKLLSQTETLQETETSSS
jgi:uncharacterized membrane protein